MIVITITAGNKSYIERIPDRDTRVNRDPEYYRDIHFILKNRRSVEKYREHFIYQYLESMGRSGDAPAFIVRARKVEVTVRREKE
jgi:hypothetical protein